MRVVACYAVSELVHVGFAENDGASFLELLDRRSVVQREEICEDARASGRGDVFSVDVVFQRDGDAMKRPAVVMTAAGSEKFGFSLLGLCEGEFGGHGDVGVQLGVELGDAREHETDELDGGEFAFTEKESDFFDGCEG